MRGGKYSANIVLAASDTTQAPAIYIGGQKLPEDRNGLYEFVCGKTGVFDFSGYLEVPHGDGTLTRHDFTSSYTVIGPHGDSIGNDDECSLCRYRQSNQYFGSGHSDTSGSSYYVGRDVDSFGKMVGSHVRKSRTGCDDYGDRIYGGTFSGREYDDFPCSEIARPYALYRIQR